MSALLPFIIDEQQAVQSFPLLFAVHGKSNYGSHDCIASHHFAILLELEQEEVDLQGLQKKVQKSGFHLKAKKNSAELHDHQHPQQTSFNSSVAVAEEHHCLLFVSSGSYGNG